MAVPRVFISSTYYDLRQVRFNVGDFIKNLGYEVVMHERSGVAYTQNEPLERDCYHEMASCDIAVCIIGNHFGSQSIDNELSITMNEIQTAIQNKKKVYIFIAKDVYIENRTYEHNKDNGGFRSAYTDDIRIHVFISELKRNARVMIESFETTDDIARTLKLQFAGLFQNLLAREASLSDSKVAFDLQQSSDVLKAVIEELRQEKDAFFGKFEGTVFAGNAVMQVLRKHLNIKRVSFFLKDDASMDEFMEMMGFQCIEVEEIFDDHRKYVRSCGNKYETIVAKVELFDDNGNIKNIRSLKTAEENLIYESKYQEVQFLLDDDAQLPF